MTRATLLAAVLLSASLPAAAATTSANYLNAPGAQGDEGVINAFNYYDLVGGAAVIQANANNQGTLSNPATGDVYSVYYEGAVSSHVLKGTKIALPSLTNLGNGQGFELTMVANFTEQVTGAGFGISTQVTGGSLGLYFDTHPNRNYLTDSGFTDGSQLLSANILNGSGALFPQNRIGVTSFNLSINNSAAGVYGGSVASAVGALRFDFRKAALDSLQRVLGQRAGAGGVYVTTDGTLALTTAEIAPIPVPAAVWLLGSGLAGLTALRRRKI